MSVINWRVWPKEDLVEVVDAIEKMSRSTNWKVGIGVDVHFTRFYTCALGVLNKWNTATEV